MEKRKTILTIKNPTKDKFINTYEDITFITLKLLQNYELVRMKTKAITRTKEINHFDGYKTVSFIWRNGYVETFHNIPTKGITIDIDELKKQIEGGF